MLSKKLRQALPPPLPYIQDEITSSLPSLCGHKLSTFNACTSELWGVGRVTLTYSCAFSDDQHVLKVLHAGSFKIFKLTCVRLSNNQNYLTICQHSTSLKAAGAWHIWLLPPVGFLLSVVQQPDIILYKIDTEYIHIIYTVSTSTGTFMALWIYRWRTSWLRV